MPTSPATTWLRRASVVALLPVAFAAGSAGAAKRKPTAPAPPPVLRFPDTVSDGLLHDLTQAGRVTADLPPDPEQWKRWGRAAPDDQDLAVRAVVDALSKARPPIDLSAMILAIARVESGFNPFSENPTSTACGIFQFVEGTWQSYADTRDRCFDPYVNAWAGVRHLAKLDMIRLGEARRLLQGVPDEVQRIEYLYRLLYAYHYHGVRSVFASIGGSLQAQTAADTGVPYLKRYFSILKRATYVPPPVRRKATGKGRARGGAHPRGSGAVRHHHRGGR